MESQSKESTVLMFYVMSQHNHKCVFKNPKNWNRSSVRESAEWVYPSRRESFQTEVEEWESEREEGE